MVRILATALLLAICPDALAGEVALTVSAAGVPLAGAVVTLHTSNQPAGPIRLAPSYVVAQRNIAFEPHVLIVPVTAEVAFANQDRVRHHVFSFSRAKRFELKLFGQEQARKIGFETPGVVAIGCNIHDRMSGYIVVVDTPYALQTDARGVARWAEIGAGAATATVWHPRLRAPGNTVSVPVTVPASGTAARTVAVELRPEIAATAD